MKNAITLWGWMLIYLFSTLELKTRIALTCLAITAKAFIDLSRYYYGAYCVSDLQRKKTLLLSSLPTGKTHSICWEFPSLEGKCKVTHAANVVSACWFKMGVINAESYSAYTKLSSYD